MSSSPDRGADGGELFALLGPTNTGKTHRAIERMLEHQTGMLGFPLRLLAREVYDRVSLRVGEQAVALITGEEKRIPRYPRYYVCTVEAMPLDVASEFVGIDEIQLIAHPERGHVFTDRLLHMRGTRETWFLGSQTARWLVQRLLPQIAVQGLPRLSQLRHTGRASIRTVPRRSAVVTFSMPAVYELADLIRVRRGGAAVVLGALSPRVRNAQVALYQAGDVDFLVATDAIGMGLNLDIDHVALAARSKFDGFETRPLEAAEIAQIVGRAGRHTRDGTFGTLAPESELPPKLVAQLESHTFPALRSAFYRSSELDYGSLSGLLTSLGARPPLPELRAAPEGDDVATLRELARRDEVQALAGGPEAVRLAWQLCLVPNYEKLLPQHQADRLWPLYAELIEHGHIAAARVRRALLRLTQFEGDIHVLMDRLAAVRTWTYLSHQQSWVEDGPALREQARELEDRLSDALHELLVARFVDTSRVSRTRAAAAVDDSGPFAGLRSRLPEESAPSSPGRWVESIVSAAFEDLTLDARARIHVRGERVASLVHGPQLRAPAIKLQLPDGLDGGARTRIERRALAHIRDLLDLLQLASENHDSPLVRGLAYQLSQGLGTVPTRTLRPQLDALDPATRQNLEARGVVFGRHSVYLESALSAAALDARLALVRVHVADDAQSVEPLAGALAVATPRADPPLLSACGFVPLRSVSVRCDLLEAVSATHDLPAPERLSLVGRLLAAPEALAALVIEELPRRRKRRPRKR